MYVNGIYVTESTVLDELEKLPSFFPEYLSSERSRKTEIQVELINLFNNNVVQLYAKENAAVALQNFESLENTANLSNSSPEFMARVRFNIGHYYLYHASNNKALEYFEKAIPLSIDSRNEQLIEDSFKGLVIVHQKQGTLKRYKEQQEEILKISIAKDDQAAELKARYALGTIAKITKNKKESIKHFSRIYSLSQGRIDGEAHRIEQHEVGFSDSEKIGTDNIQQCVTIIIRDPISKKTALAHVDRVTNPKSLASIISRFDAEAKLEVYLVGGRDLSPQGRKTSNENISKVITELTSYKRHIDIKSADIGERGSPSGVVFNPKTAKLEHAVPGKYDKTSHLRVARVSLARRHPSLHEAFDFTKSKEIPEVKFTEEEKHALILQSKSLNNIPGSEAWKANLLYEPYNKTLEEIAPSFSKRILSKLRDGIDKLKEIGKKISQKVRSTFISNDKKLVTSIKTTENKQVDINAIEDNIRPKDAKEELKPKDAEVYRKAKRLKETFNHYNDRLDSTTANNTLVVSKKHAGKINAR